MNRNIDPNIGKATQFTSENQPPNESKQVPKWKTKLKKYFRENIDVFEKKLKKGDQRAWEWVHDVTEGKIPNKNEDKITIDKLPDININVKND